jgi:hypothetical protein
MADAPGWKPDPERDDRERSWSGSAWTDRVDRDVKHIDVAGRTDAGGAADTDEDGAFAG